tara:strand:- start:488 stop:745 length:258 start_codon:yes stop_codon:yes gene_type:complete
MVLRLYVFITIKKHFKELAKQKQHYEKLLNEVSSFHQMREHKINSIVDSFFDRFSNKSATRGMNEIKEVMSVINQPSDNGNKKTN